MIRELGEWGIAAVVAVMAWLAILYASHALAVWLVGW